MSSVCSCSVFSYPAFPNIPSSDNYRVINGCHCFRALGEGAASRPGAALVGALRFQLLLFLSPPACPEHIVLSSQSVPILPLDEFALLGPGITLIDLEI